MAARSGAERAYAGEIHALRRHPGLYAAYFEHQGSILAGNQSNQRLRGLSPPSRRCGAVIHFGIEVIADEWIAADVSQSPLSFPPRLALKTTDGRDRITATA